MSNIYWILSSSIYHGSSRIHGYNIHKELVRKGFQSTILFDLIDYRPYAYFNQSHFKLFGRFLQPHDLVILQKLKDENTLKFIDYLQRLSVRTVFLDCDLPVNEKIARQVDLTIVPSNAMAEAYCQEGITNMQVIPDAVEEFTSPSEQAQKNHGPEFKCAWFGVGNQRRWPAVQFLEKIFEKPGLENWTFTSFSNYKKADEKWTAQTLSRIKAEYDAVAIPVLEDGGEFTVKSANKITQSMALGLPVLASPMKAYLEVVEDQVNGLICRDENDWIRNFQRLENEDYYQKIRKNGLITAQEYSPEEIIPLWIEALQLNQDYQTADQFALAKPIAALRRQVYHNLYKASQGNAFYLDMLKASVNPWQRLGYQLRYNAKDKILNWLKRPQPSKLLNL